MQRPAADRQPRCAAGRHQRVDPDLRHPDAVAQPARQRRRQDRREHDDEGERRGHPKPPGQHEPARCAVGEVTAHRADAGQGEKEHHDDGAAGQQPHDCAPEIPTARDGRMLIGLVLARVCGLTSRHPGGGRMRRTHPAR